MKVLFLISAFIPFILTVHAQRSFNQYTCQVSHKHSDVAFYLDVGDRKEVEIGGWKVYANIERKENAMEVTLSRIVNVLDATYKKDAKRSYPLSARTLPVVLEHSFGGRTDVFTMNCYARDP